MSDKEKTENLLEPEKNEDTEKSRFYHNEKLIIGIFIGLLIGVPFSLFGLKYFADNVTIITTVLLVIILLVGLIAILILAYKERILKHLFGRVEVKFESITKHGIESLELLSKGEVESSRESAKEFVKELSAWYSWVTFRRWMIGSIIAIVATFAGLIGAVLLYRQNELITEQTSILTKQSELISKQNDLTVKQNEKIDVQSYLLESQRRSGLIIELTSILESIQLSSQNQTPLSATIKGRIVALSRVLKPYHYVHISDSNGSIKTNNSNEVYTPKLIKNPLSPERGQLLLALINSKINMQEIIALNPDFSSADLSNAEIKDIDLSNINLQMTDFSNSTLSSVKFNNARLEGAKFNQSFLENTQFIEAKLRLAEFNRATLDNPDFSKSNLERTNFEATRMNQPNFNKTYLFYTVLKNSVLGSGVFNQALNFNADFSGSFVGGCNFDGLIIYSGFNIQVEKLSENHVTHTQKDAEPNKSGQEWVLNFSKLNLPIKGFEPSEWEMKIEEIESHPFTLSKGKFWVVRSKGKNN